MQPYGLPSGFFKEIDRSADAEFLRWDSLIADSTRESLGQRLQCQASSHVAKQLADLIWSTCPRAVRETQADVSPPLAIAGVEMPLKKEARLLFVSQPALSKHKREAMNAQAEKRLRYGIDELTTTTAQLPAYVIPKGDPAAGEFRFVIDGSVLSERCLEYIGTSLTTKLKLERVLSGAKAVSAIDFRAAFSSVRVAEWQRDLVTWVGGVNGSQRLTRLCPGASTSPAIMQALMAFIFSPANLGPELASRVCFHIDNLYVAHASSNTQQQLQDLVPVLKVINRFNLTLNLKSSIWLGTSQIPVLGRLWDSTGDWRLSDDRVRNIRHIETPRTMKSLRGAAGALSSMATHVPWAGELLSHNERKAAGDDAGSLKWTRLTREEIQSIEEPFARIREAMGCVEHLHIPGPGARFLLCVDASDAAAGGVLSVDYPDAPGEYHIVAFSTLPYPGAQGKQHPGWRESWALVEICRHLYPYIDTPDQLIILSDASTALGLFGHQAKAVGADDLVTFKLRLNAMGLTKRNVLYLPGRHQYVADYLSRAYSR
ncbi:DNA/RNA polymerase, partial [Ramicandelaber brevisporus]